MKQLCGESIMATNVAMWGTSLGVHLPKHEAERAGIESGTSVNVYVEDQRLIIEKAKPRYSIDDLVSMITPENLHGEFKTGASKGNESW